MFENLSFADYAIIAGYFIIVFAVAAYVTIRERRAKKEGYGSSDYFLGGKNIGWFVIGASLFASNIGSEHLVGLAGAGAGGGFAAGQFELLAALILIILGWVFVPFYLKSGVFTMPEFLERRYSRGARDYLSIVSIVGYVLTKISLTVLAGAIVFEVMGLEFWTGAITVVIATGIYTIFGGLRAVVFTDMMQMFVLLAGSLAVTLYGLEALGGWDVMVQTIERSVSQDGNLDKGSFFSLWRPMDDPNYPWTGIVFGAPILGIWYWCTDQFIVQRVLSAKNISHARRGTLFGGFLKLLPIFLFVIPGVVAYALAQENLLTLDLPEQALPTLINDFLPNGLKGLVLAGLLAALMSSLSSVFNSCSTLFTIDFYKVWRSKASERELVFVGQVATVVLVVISLLWVPILRNMLKGGGSFYAILQSIQGYISPPIAAAFLLGLFIKRLTARGAVWALWTGFVLGMVRLLFEVLKSEGVFIPEPGTLIDYLVSVNFLHYAIFLFLVSAAVMIAGSLTTPPYGPDKLKNVTYEPPDSPETRFHPSNPDFWWTIVLMGLVVFIWVVFSPWGLAG